MIGCRMKTYANRAQFCLGRLQRLPRLQSAVDGARGAKAFVGRLSGLLGPTDGSVCCADGDAMGRLQNGTVASAYWGVEDGWDDR